MRHRPDTDEGIDRQASIWEARTVGTVVLSVGVAAIGLLAWALYRTVLLNRLAELGNLALIAAFAVLSVFFLSVGWRLFLNRPNRHGSILGPTAWRVLGTIFALFAAALVSLMATFGPEPVPIYMFLMGVISVVSASVFSFWSFRAAQRAAAHARKGNAAI